MPSNANHTLNSYEVVATFHASMIQPEESTVTVEVNAESQEAARELVADIVSQTGYGKLFEATVTPSSRAAVVSDLSCVEVNPAHDYAVALASCINVQSISDEDELQSIATRIARTANAIAAQMGGAK